MSLLHTLWARWSAFAHRLGQIQTTILLSIVYLIALGPISLIVRLRGHDLLGLRRSQISSYWAPIPPISSDIERARRQF
jgi:hypothetical protein